MEEARICHPIKQAILVCIFSKILESFSTIIDFDFEIFVAFLKPMDA